MQISIIKGKQLQGQNPSILKIGDLIIISSLEEP